MAKPNKGKNKKYFLKLIKESWYDEQLFYFVIKGNLYRLNVTEVKGKNYQSAATPSDRIFTFNGIVTDFMQTDTLHIVI